MHQSNVIQNKICTQRRHRNTFSELSQISVVHQSEVISFMIMHHRKILKRASILKYSRHIKTKEKNTSVSQLEKRMQHFTDSGQKP